MSDVSEVKFHDAEEWLTRARAAVDPDEGSNDAEHDLLEEAMEYVARELRAKKATRARMKMLHAAEMLQALSERLHALSNRMDATPGDPFDSSEVMREFVTLVHEAKQVERATGTELTFLREYIAEELDVDLFSKDADA